MCLRIIALTALVFLGHAREYPGNDVAVEVETRNSPAMPEELFVSSRSHTTVQHTTAADEVGSAAKNALFGFFLFIFGFPVLWFNEAREAKMWMLFGRARDNMKDVSDTPIQSDNEASLVHVTGTSGTDQTLQADSFPVSVSNCTKLKTTVEMYQWTENSSEETKDDNMGGKTTTTTYTYSQSWSSSAIDSTSFNDSSYQNPPMPFQGGEKQASSVSLGAFSLTKRLIDKTSKFTNVEPGEVGDMDGFYKNGSGYTNMASGQQPQTGSLRINFSKVPCGPTSVIALQHNTSFAPLTYTMKIEGGKVTSPDGNLAPLLDKADDDDIEVNAQGFVDAGICGKICCCCKFIGSAVESREEVYELAEKQMSGGAMLDLAASSQEACHTAFKWVGWLMLICGLDMMMTFFPTLFRFIPFAGIWIQWILNGAAHICAFLLGSFFYLVTVALAWFAYRPMKAILCLVVAFSLIAVGTYFANQNQP